MYEPRAHIVLGRNKTKRNMVYIYIYIYIYTYICIYHNVEPPSIRVSHLDMHYAEVRFTVDGGQPMFALSLDDFLPLREDLGTNIKRFHFCIIRFCVTHVS